MAIIKKDEKYHKKDGSLMNKDDDVIICRAAGMANAQIILGRLQADGISARLQYDAIGTILYSLTVDGLGEVRIFVAKEDVEQAWDILAQHFEETDLKWDEN
jgi:hypothetical protein